MKNQERLFLAVGGAAPELVARSEQKRRSRWTGYCLAAVASLALIFSLGYVRPFWTEPVVVPPDSQQTGVTQPDPLDTQKPDPDGWQSPLLPPHGSEIGTLRLLSYAPQSQDKAVDFLIYVNEEQFFISEEDGIYSIRSTDPLPENFPELGLDIFHLSGMAPEVAAGDAQDALKGRYMGVSSEEMTAALPGSLYLRASAGTDWDSEQEEFWFVDDGQGGTFVLTARYFLEAEEGIGARFRDMVSSFRVVSLNEAIPDWMRELYQTAEQLFLALFANDLTGVSGLLTEDSVAEAYGENVWSDITVASVDYTLDDDRNPSSATVSVKHHLNQVEGDSFRYLTMHLLRQEDKWFLDWAGIEK